VSEQLRIGEQPLATSGVPTFAQVLMELNAIRAIVFGPSGKFHGATRAALSDHLMRIQIICEAATRVPR
jgi:hypothetical protein